MQQDNDHTIGAVSKSSRIVKWLGETVEADAEAIAEGTAIPLGTVHNHLRTLRLAGLVDRGPDATYRLSLRFLEYGDQMRQQWSFYRVGRTAANTVAEATGEFVALASPTPLDREPDRVVWIYSSEGDRAVADGRLLGAKQPLHATAAGKAILSIHNVDEKETLPANLAAETNRTTTDVTSVLQQVQTTVNRGFATANEEYSEGIAEVAAPVTDDNDPAGAITVIGPINRFDSDYRTEIGQQLREAASTVSVQLEMR